MFTTEQEIVIERAKKEIVAYCEQSSYRNSNYKIEYGEIWFSENGQLNVNYRFLFKDIMGRDLVSNRRYTYEQ